MLREAIALPNTSKIWIYQATREFSYDEIDEIRHQLFEFADQWKSHGMPVHSYANIFHRRFLVFMADEGMHGVSGCSTDESVHLVQSLSEEMKVDFFDRLHFCYMDNQEEIHCLTRQEFVTQYKDGTLTEETLVFDHLVKTKGEFLTHWIKPIKESWHKKFLS